MVNRPDEAFYFRAATTGGPVAVMTLANVTFWRGDIFRVCNSFRDTPTVFQFYQSEEGYTCVLFREMLSDGQFEVFGNANSFVVLDGWGNCPDDCDFAPVIAKISCHLNPAKAITISDFGGKVTLFDAVVPGRHITLRRPGVESIFNRISREEDDPIQETPDTLLIEVALGEREVAAIGTVSDLYVESGILFQRRPPNKS